MRRSRIAVSVCGVVAILAASVSAQQASERGLAGRFARFDKGNDLPVSAAERADPSGMHKVHAGGLERESLVHVPAALPADRAVPLVLVFHGGGGTASRRDRSIKG